MYKSTIDKAIRLCDAKVHDSVDIDKVRGKIDNIVAELERM